MTFFDSYFREIVLVGSIVVGFLGFIALILFQRRKSSKTIETRNQDPGEPNDDIDFDSLVRENKENSNLSGKTANYDWTQTDTEVEILVKAPSDLQTKNVQVVIKPSSLKIVVNKNVIVDGDLFSNVQPDDCCWVVDTSASGEKAVWITLFKSSPAIWSQIVLTGPAIHAVDTSNPGAMREAARQFNSRQKG